MVDGPRARGAGRPGEAASRLGPVREGRPGTPRSRGGGSGSGLGAPDAASRSPGQRPRSDGVRAEPHRKPDIRAPEAAAREARRVEARAREDGAPLGGSARASGSEGGRPRRPARLGPCGAPGARVPPPSPSPRRGEPGGRAAGAAARPGSAGRGAARRRAQGQGMADAPSACAYVRESGRGRERAEPGRPPLALSSEAAPRAPGRAAPRPSPRPSPRPLAERGPGRWRLGVSGALAPRRARWAREPGGGSGGPSPPFVLGSQGLRSESRQPGPGSPARGVEGAPDSRRGERKSTPGGDPAGAREPPPVGPRGGPGQPNEGRPCGEGPGAQTRGRCGRSNWLLTEKLRGGVGFQ
ncbi:collagen alpha-1(I) chain-like [Lagenorhynchus albirostris]|uniref:collagen alpha-1(I) chain-like n=1 Tax=Lagenorhynchus albirostris TaxID=27610 RepID=UPI0028E859BB|nr:collagen alpha-1(I) chain-like [Lagenorhynchus albirostris]